MKLKLCLDDVNVVYNYLYDYEREIWDEKFRGRIEVLFVNIIVYCK